MKKPPPEKTPTPEPTPEQVADLVKILDFMANPDGAEQASSQQPEANTDAFWAEANPKIRIRTQLGIALTIASNGDFYIRQHACPRDQLIIITPHFQLEFLEALCDVLGVRPPQWRPKS